MQKRIINEILKNKRFLITAHMNLEGDALGSELSMYHILRKLGKYAVIYNNDITPSAYRFLPYIDKITYTSPSDNFDIAFILDCSDASRTGKVKDSLSNIKKIINIDHHISNTKFGDINWVEPNASSTCEMMYKFAKKIGIMDKKIAVCLYTGIFTDTGGFTYSNTNAYVHKIVAELIRYNIRPHDIYTKITSCCQLADLKFISSLFKNLKVDYEYRVGWIVVKKWPQNTEFDLTEIIFSMMRLLKGVDVFILFKKIDKKGKVRINFRSRSKRVDVNKVAKFFGGGGHRSASGTTVEMDLDFAEKNVISFIKRYINIRRKK